MKHLYLWVDFLSVIFPFFFSFHPKIRFYTKWKFLFPGILFSAIPFLVWDIYFTHIGIWGFTPAYLSGFYFFNLPVEEVLFFICIPYACLFTYHCLCLFIEKDYFLKYENNITVFLILTLLIVGLLNISLDYTTFTFFFLTVLLFLLKKYFKITWLSRFYFSYLLLMIPFTIVNGILTGTGLNEPVVWYNNHENLNIRILTIPIEDVFYGMLLILLNTSFYEFLKSSNEKGILMEPSN